MNWISVERANLLRCKATVFALISCFAANGEASNLSTNWWFVLPKTVASQKALQMKGTYKWVQQSLSVSAEIPTVFENIEADIGYEVKGFNPAPSGSGWALNMLIPSLVFKASSLNMNGVVERVVNGTKVRVNIKANCTGVVASAQRPFSVAVGGEIKNQPFNMDVSSVVWNEDAALWNITAQSCTPAGFLPFVNQQVNAYWKDSASFKQAFISELNKHISDWATNNSAMTKDFPEFSTKMNVRAVEFIDKGSNWVFRLESKITTEKKCLFAEAGTIKDATIPAPTTAVLVIPEGLVSKWSQCLHEMGHFKRLDDSSKTSFQTSIMDSPSAQGYVWPDLQRYSSSTKFDIKTSSLGNWNMTPTTETTAANYKIKTGILTQFILNRYGKKTPYVTFWGTFDGILNLSKVGENLVLKISGTPTASVKYKFDMVNSAITNKTIDSTRLKDEMITALKAEQMTLKIPTYTFSQAGTFQATSLTRSTGALNFVIDFTK